MSRLLKVIYYDYDAIIIIFITIHTLLLRSNIRTFVISLTISLSFFDFSLMKLTIPLSTIRECNRKFRLIQRSARYC